MRFTGADGGTYTEETGSDSIRNWLGRYNENSGVYISLHFKDSENPELLEEIRNDLKDIYMNEIRSLLDSK